MDKPYVVTWAQHVNREDRVVSRHDTVERAARRIRAANAKGVWAVAHTSRPLTADERSVAARIIR